MARTILVFGASGTVGQGLIKAILEKGIRAVGVFRSQESAEKTRARLGNPPQDRFISVIGTADTEANAAKLQQQVVEAAKEITDVFSSFGGWKQGGPLLQQSADYLIECIGADKIVPHFLAAKHFLPLIQDKADTSYTFINGAAAYNPAPNSGNMTIANGCQLKLVSVICSELSEKPVRINEAVIAAFVRPWDTVQTSVENSIVSSADMGKALLGVALNPAAKGLSMTVGAKDVEKLASEGKV